MAYTCLPSHVRQRNESADIETLSRRKFLDIQSILNDLMEASLLQPEAPTSDSALARQRIFLLGKPAEVSTLRAGGALLTVTVRQSISGALKPQAIVRGYSAKSLCRQANN